MAGKGGDFSGDITLGSDTWNVADGFTKLKILRQLVMLDQWETIAQFGGEEFDGDLNMNDNQIKKRRVEGLQRFHATLRQLIGNVMFALKSEDKKKIKMMGERIDNVKEFLGEVYEMREDDITHEEVFDVDEKKFGLILGIFQDVKDNLNILLNNANLIFRQSEDIDLDQIMGDIIKGG